MVKFKELNLCTAFTHRCELFIKTAHTNTQSRESNVINMTLHEMEYMHPDAECEIVHLDIKVSDFFDNAAEVNASDPNTCIHFQAIDITKPHTGWCHCNKNGKSFTTCGADPAKCQKDRYGYRKINGEFIEVPEDFKTWDEFYKFFVSLVGKKEKNG